MNLLYRRNMMYSQVSPYSSQATAALKAQFPTQWPTIRDYGFAHPALVPFINEDPMLVMSLIDGLGVRNIIGDGLSIIITDVTPIKGFKIRAEATIDTITDKRYLSLCGFRNGTDNNIYSNIGCNDVRSASFCSYGSVSEFNVGRLDNQIPIGENFIYELTNGKVKYGNVEKNFTGSSNGFTDENKPRFIIFSTGNTTDSRYILTGKIKFIELILSDNVTNKFVPCFHNNAVGMLDIVNARWYENAGSGSFTISETPAS